MKKIVIIVSVMLLMVSVFPIWSANADDITVSEFVTLTEAKKAALNQIQISSNRIEKWLGASITEPTLYYAPDDNPSAYEFSVMNKESEVGYILVSARRYLVPVLEYSTDPAPSKLMTPVIETAIEKGFAKPSDRGDIRLLYWGPLSYSVQIGEKMKQENKVVHLPTGRLVHMETMKIAKVDEQLAIQAWAKIEKESQTKSIGWVEISGVPLWYQHSEACGGCCDAHSDYADEYPDCAGNDPDPWIYWDGCAPISGAMIIGYWLTAQYDDEEYIDDCHHYMETGDEDGYTYYLNIDNGIRDAFGTHGYSMDVDNDLIVTWGDITTEVDAERPFVLSDDEHCPTGVGYEYDTGDPSYKKVWIHTTWYSPRTAIIDYNSWNLQVMTKVSQ